MHNITAIISNMNGMKYLPRLLESLRAQIGVTVQIVVVDRLSCDNSLSYLTQQPDVYVVHEPPETGLVSGYDAGARYARHEFLFFCNEDMWFDPDCLLNLVIRIDMPAGIVAADPWQWTYGGESLIHGGTRFVVTKWNALCPFPFCRYYFTENVDAGEVVPFACAGAFLIHQEAYGAVGGWDTSFFLDHEDVDLFIRIWQCGQKCVSVPEARVYHAVGASNNHHIAALNTPVKKRRHISGLANISIIGIKYFTGWTRLYALLYPFLSILKEAIRFRPFMMVLSCLAAFEVFQRYSNANRFRKLWSFHNRLRPGQFFFQSLDFQLKHKK